MSRKDILFKFPSHIPRTASGANIALASQLLDATNEKSVLLCEPPKTGNVRKLHFPIVGVTTPGNLDARMEQIDYTADPAVPNGSLIATNTNAVAAISAPNSLYTVTLTADCPVTRAVPLAVVFSNQTGAYNIGVGGNSISGVGAFPYNAFYTGSWAFSGASLPFVIFEYDDGSTGYANGVLPIALVTSTSFNSGSATEYGNRYQFPVGVYIRGFEVTLRMITTPFDFVIYDIDGTTPLATRSVAPQLHTGVTNLQSTLQFDLSSDVPFVENGLYRGVIKPGATSVSLASYNIPSSGLIEATPGGLALGRGTSRISAGAWTDSDANVVALALIVGGIEVPAGGGGIARLVGDGLIA